MKCSFNSCTYFSKFSKICCYLTFQTLGCVVGIRPYHCQCVGHTAFLLVFVFWSLPAVCFRLTRPSSFLSSQTGMRFAFSPRPWSSLLLELRRQLFLWLFVCLSLSQILFTNFFLLSLHLKGRQGFHLWLQFLSCLQQPIHGQAKTSRPELDLGPQGMWQGPRKPSHPLYLQSVQQQDRVQAPHPDLHCKEGAKYLPFSSVSNPWFH